VDKRTLPSTYQTAKKGRLDSLQHWTSEDGVVTGPEEESP
jgi:hypothetical protein